MVDVPIISVINTPSSQIVKSTASITDNAIVRGDSATSVVGVQTSLASIDDSGNITTPGTVTSLQPYRAITALRTLDATDENVNCTSNSFTVTLPTAVGITGKIYNIKNSGTGIITIATTSSQTIDDVKTLSLAQWEGITVVSMGTNRILL